MKLEDLYISDLKFIGIVLYLGIFCFLLLFNIFLATLFYFSVIILSLLLMLLDKEENRRGKWARL